MNSSALRSLLLSSTTAFGVLIGCAGSAHARSLVSALEGLSGPTIIQRTVTLADLGVVRPIELSSIASARDIYFPVASGIPLIDPSLAMDGSYLRADGGLTTYTLAIDGSTVAARSLTTPQGKTAINIGVDGSPRQTGFVQIGLDWSSIIPVFRCGADQPIGNVLEIATDTALHYSYNASDITDLASAWSAMPNKVSVLVASDALSPASYAAAWRLGIALERAGKTVKIITFPQVGSLVDVSALAIPNRLMVVPAFAALAQGGTITLQNEAEIGALLLLNAPQFRAQVAVTDPALRAELNTALEAVKNELTAADANTGPVFDAIAQQKDSLAQPVAPKSISLLTLAGPPLIAVSPDAAASATNLFSQFWQKTAVASHLIVNYVHSPVGLSQNSDQLDLLGQTSGALDVLARGDWTTSLDLASLPKNKIPTALDIYVSAAPGASATLPVASVFINNILLGARRITADGRPELIRVAIAPYMLLPRNIVRVEFQRQPESDHCNELPQAFPVAVLPGSEILLTSATADAKNFSGVIPWLTGDAEVMVPNTWVNEATKTLPTLITVADAAGISPDTANLDLLANDVVSVPTQPFLAFDLPVKGAGNTAKVSGQRVSISTPSGKTFYDVSGLNKVAVLQVKTGNGHPGLVYQNVGAGPQFNKTFNLSYGDTAILGNDGVLAVVNNDGTLVNPNEDLTLAEEDGKVSNHGLVWFLAQNISWISALIVVLAFLLLLWRAKYSRDKNKDQG